MKNVVLKNSKKFQKVSEKVFTDRERNSKIRKDNPLKVNYKIYRRGSGLYKMKGKVWKEKNKLNLKEFTIERIKTNTNLFTEEELTLVKNNIALIEKIYILGILDNI